MLKMKTNKMHLLIFSISFFLSCKPSKPVKTFELLLVVTDRIESSSDNTYSSTFQYLSSPIITNDNFEFDFAPMPLSILKLTNRRNFMYSIDIGMNEMTNDKILSPYQTHTEAYFKDKKVEKELLVSNDKNFNAKNSLDSLIKELGPKKKLFFYSNKSRDTSYNNEIIYSDKDTLQKKICSFLTTNPSYSIAIIIDPPKVFSNETNTEISSENNIDPSGITVNSNNSPDDQPDPITEFPEEIKSNESAPAPPQDISLSLSDNDMDIKWTSAGNAYTYEIKITEKDPDTKTFVVVGNTHNNGVNELSYNVTSLDLKRGKSYYINVTPISTNGQIKGKTFIRKFGLKTTNGNLDPECH